MELAEHMRRIDQAIDDMTTVAETRFLRKVRRLSRAFPDRLFTVNGGMGSLNVYISAKQTHHCEAFTRYTSSGSRNEVEYDLSHGDDNSSEWLAPKCLHAARDWLYGEMEEIESTSVLWHFGPMIAPVGYYRNGLPVDRP